MNDIKYINFTDIDFNDKIVDKLNTQIPYKLRSEFKVLFDKTDNSTYTLNLTTLCNNPHNVALNLVYQNIDYLTDNDIICLCKNKNDNILDILELIIHKLKHKHIKELLLIRSYYKKESVNIRTKFVIDNMDKLTNINILKYVLYSDYAFDIGFVENNLQKLTYDDWLIICSNSNERAVNLIEQYILDKFKKRTLHKLRKFFNIKETKYTSYTHQNILIELCKNKNKRILNFINNNLEWIGRYLTGITNSNSGLRNLLLNGSVDNITHIFDFVKGIKNGLYFTDNNKKITCNTNTIYACPHKEYYKIEDITHNRSMLNLYNIWNTIFKNNSTEGVNLLINNFNYCKPLFSDMLFDTLLNVELLFIEDVNTNTYEKKIKFLIDNNDILFNHMINNDIDLYYNDNFYPVIHTDSRIFELILMRLNNDTTNNLKYYNFFKSHGFKNPNIFTYDYDEMINIKKELHNELYNIIQVI